LHVNEVNALAVFSVAGSGFRREPNGDCSLGVDDGLAAMVAQQHRAEAVFDVEWHVGLLPMG
jgi:hypothetical protein